ncbi:MAG: ATP-binding cassette domain-containing protein [Verrucomicrobiales bacterium]|jgi:phospholipid/cholesterol/gamma-HCH transport system ATP-binding protein|nr:ATP-binding cassette domain-containing protein [Verrucomicrobiales bacterium]
MSAPTNPELFFEIAALRQTLGGHDVLRGVSFNVPKGKTTVILGGSGAGKSVLLKHLNGLMRPLSGTVKVKGIEIGTMSERALTPIRRQIGVLFQDGALFDSMTVGENVAFPLREAGVRDEAFIAHRVDEVLHLVGLKGQDRKMPDVLSGGMRKRVSLARAIAGKPECLLYDEPTAGLDPILSESITRLIAKLKDELRLTSVVVTHNLGAMRFVADQVIFLKHGEVHFAGPPPEIDASDDPAIREFINADAMGRE